MQNQTSQQVLNKDKSEANGLVEIDASLLHLVGGGSPKGTWSEVDSPKGTWNDTEGEASPKGTW